MKLYEIKNNDGDVIYLLAESMFDLVHWLCDYMAINEIKSIVCLDSFTVKSTK